MNSDQTLFNYFQILLLQTPVVILAVYMTAFIVFPVCLSTGIALSFLTDHFWPVTKLVIGLLCPFQNQFVETAICG